ncbi:MAG: T9SS type A sorting domain-containing protein [Bacteroidetes bacterium]|nr:T9SS type A sorting domain-containing protein [Bacteroidota bacterium]
MNVLNIRDSENYKVLSIFDFSGRIIYNGSANKCISLQNLSPGIYFCNLTDKFNRFSGAKFIVL